MKWNLTSGLAADTVLYPRINETGRLYTADEDEDEDGSLACGGISKEFNPLKETDVYGRPNPYQNFSRGRLDSLTVEMDSGVTDVIQNFLLQNLSEPDSIIGKSISMYLIPLADVVEVKLTGSTFTAIEACCTIALDETP